MKQWQQAFLKEICHKDIKINETDFEQVYAFMLKQFPYNRRTTLKNFASLVRQSVHNKEFVKSVNYYLLQKKAQEYIKEVRPNFEMAFEIGMEYINAYQEMIDAQNLLQEKNEKLFALEKAWDKSNTEDHKEEKNSAEFTTKKNSKQELIDAAKKIQLENLGLNAASYNRLKRADIHTVYQLCCMSEKQLISLKGIGRKNYECIKQRLYMKGYAIGMLIN